MPSNVFKQVPPPKDRNIIVSRHAFRHKIERGTFIKHSARHVARDHTKVSGVNYHEAYLPALIVPFESFRTFIPIAALFNLKFYQFDVSATYLHKDIVKEGIHGAFFWLREDWHRMVPPEGSLQV